VAISGEWRAFHAPEIDKSLLQASLTKSGVSLLGAQQIVTGSPVTIAADRQILIGLLAQLLTQSKAASGAKPRR
jgi:hypothetical protein